MMTLKEICVEAGIPEPLIQERFDRIQCIPAGDASNNPFPWQVSGVGTLLAHSWSERSSLWDEPGAGKTIPMQVLLLVYHLNGIKSVMTMPPKLIGKWIEAFERDWVIPDDLKPCWYIQDKTPAKRREDYERWIDDGFPDIQFMSYERFRTDIRKLVDVGNYKAFLFDEADKLSNAKTKVWMAIWTIVYATQGMFGVHLFTGSPIRNVPTDAYGLIKLNNPGKFFDYAEFYNFVVDKEITVRGQDQRTGMAVDRVIGYEYKNLDKLGKILLERGRQVKLRDIVKDLPPMTTIEVPVALKASHSKLYRSFINSRLLELDGKLINAEHVSQYRQLAMRMLSCPQHYVDEDQKEKAVKDNEILKAADEIVESVNPHKNKMIIWAWYQETIEFLKDHYKEYKPAVIYGAQSPSEAEANRIKFEKMPAEECGLMIVNWSAGGAGYDWQFCHHMLYFETPTVPRDVDQSARRIERPGQKNAMFAYFLRVKGTMADRNFKKLMDKAHDASLVTGQKYPVQGLKTELFGGGEIDEQGKKD